MSRILDTNEICARALRMVGAFPTSETAPNGEQLRETLYWLDLILATNAGIRAVFWLRPATATIALVPGTSDYSLRTAMGTAYPEQGVAFPVQCSIEYPSGTRLPIIIASRQTWEDLYRPAETGVPRMIYIDRLSVDQRMLVWPTLPASEAQPYKLHLEVQTNSPDLSPQGVSGARPNDATIVGVRTAWQEWLIHMLAVRIGSGPVYKLQDARLKRWGDVAEAIKRELDAFENREHDTEPPVVGSYGIEDYEAQAGSYDSYTLPLNANRGWLS